MHLLKIGEVLDDEDILPQKQAVSWAYQEGMNLGSGLSVRPSFSVSLNPGMPSSNVWLRSMNVIFISLQSEGFLD
jgi:uncharacterized protein YabE (DUF348 family)